MLRKGTEMDNEGCQTKIVELIGPLGIAALVVGCFAMLMMTFAQEPVAATPVPMVEASPTAAGAADSFLQIAGVATIACIVVGIAFLALFKKEVS
jgi:hypothetical protein